MAIRHAALILIVATATAGVASAAQMPATPAVGNTQIAQPPQPHQTSPEAPIRPASNAHAMSRDKMKWPPKPTARDLRVRGVSITKFVALARCEAGLGNGLGGARWTTPAGWTFQGGLGMYSGTHQSVGHPYGANAGQMTPYEQMLVGERVRERYGIDAWGAHACWEAA